MRNILEFDSIELSFGERRLLSNIYLKCEQGKVVGLLGRNGCGKSTLLKIVFGLQRADHKHIRINDEPVRQSGRNIRIAYLPQEDFIPSYLSIKKAFELFRIDADEVVSVYPQLKNFLLLKPDELSGGYKRFVEILLVLKSKADFCLLDEPFSGLMPLHVERIMDLIQEVKVKKGIIITDHLYRHVASLADHLYLLKDGRTHYIKEKDQLISLGYLSNSPFQQHHSS